MSKCMMNAIHCPSCGSYDDIVALSHNDYACGVCGCFGFTKTDVDEAENESVETTTIVEE